MNLDKKKAIKCLAKIIAAILASVYLTFIVDVYTLNTTPKRMFVFGYFLIICGIFVYLRERFIKKRSSMSVTVLSAVIATVILAVFQNVFLPTARSNTITLQAGETGEVWLTDIEIDGEFIPISQVHISNNYGWQYNAEYDDYVFYPKNDAADNCLSFNYIAKEVKLLFAMNTWSGTVKISDEGGEQTVIDLYGENPEENRYSFSLHTPRVYRFAERLAFDLGIFVILMFTILTLMLPLEGIFQKIIIEITRCKGKFIPLFLIKFLLILLASIYVAFLLASFMAIALRGQILIILALTLGGIFLAECRQKASKQLAVKPLLISIIVAVLIVILSKDTLLLFKQQFTVSLHGRDGEVWLTDFSKDERKVFVSWIDVQESLGWEYNEAYDDYVYYPGEYKEDNYLKIRVTAESATLHFASNSWSGTVDIMDSLGGKATYLLHTSGDGKEVTYDIVAPLRHRSLGEQLLYGGGCVIIFAFFLYVIIRRLYTPIACFFTYINGCVGDASSSYNQMRNAPKQKNCLMRGMNISTVHLFVANAAIVFVTFGCMLCDRFSPDGYGFRIHFFESDQANFLSLGRPSTFLLYLILQKIHFNPAEQQLISALLFLVIIAWTTTAIAMLIIRQFPKPNHILLIIVNLSILLSFVNVFYAELFYFSDGMLTWGGGALLVLVALQQFYKVGGYKGILITMISLYIALGFYQAYLGFFVIWGTSIILIRVLMAKKDELTECFVEWILLLVCGGCSSVLMLIQMKLTELIGFAPSTDRSPSLDLLTICSNLKKICVEQKRILFEGMSLLKWGIGIMLAILLISGVAALIRYRYKLKQCILIGAMALINYVIVFVPHILAQNVWLQPRTICSYFTLFTFGFVFITAIHYLQSSQRSYSIPILLILFLLVNVYKIQNIGVDQRTSNILDGLECREIVSYIEKYETANNVQVDTISVNYDANITWGYRGVAYAYEDMNRRIEHVAWALSDSLAYYTGRQFVVNTTPSEKHAELFQNDDWDMLEPEEQFVFDGNVVYIAAY